MKTLQNHIVFYDDECPLCNIYTKGFIKAGMLDQNGREPFYKIAKTSISLDFERAKNEIALVNKEDNTVTYGIYSLFKIIGNSFPIFKPLFSLKSFQFLMSHFYCFISFNRKVIVPGKTFEGNNTCTPAMNIKYRVSYIVFAWLITSLILFRYSMLLYEFISLNTFYRELVICGGQVLFQAVIVGFLRKERVIHYLGNLMTVSLMGAFLLLPMFLLERFNFSGTLYLTYFLCIVGLMLIEHSRRAKILELPFIVSASWVFYRVLVLYFIL